MPRHALLSLVVFATPLLAQDPPLEVAWRYDTGG